MSSDWSRQIGSRDLPAEIQCLAYSPDGRYLAISFAPRAPRLCKKVAIYETENYRCLQTFTANQSAIDRIEFSPNSRRLVTVSAGQVNVWNVDDWRLERTIIAFCYGQFSFAPDGRTLITAYDAIGLWDLETGAETMTLGPLPSGSRFEVSVAISHSGDLIAATHRTRDVTLWNVETGRRVTSFHGVTAPVRFTSDDRCLAAGTAISLWDLSMQERVWQSDSHALNIKEWCFSHAAEACLFSAGGDQFVRVWSARNGQEMTQLAGHRHPVQAVAAAPGGLILATGDLKGHLFLWDISDLEDATSPRQLSTTVSMYVDRLRVSAKNRPKRNDSQARMNSAAPSLDLSVVPELAALAKHTIRLHPLLSSTSQASRAGRSRC